MSDDDDTRTAADVFGTEPPGTPVPYKAPNHLAGYRPRPRFAHRLDGRAYRIDGDEELELEDNQRLREGDDVPSYKSAFGSFLKQEDLQGKTARVVIASVDMDDVKDNDSGKTEKKLIMHFVGKEKALILNRTNCEILEEVTGTDDYGAWVGHTVVLWTDPTVKFGGKTVGGLRIRAASNGHAAPPPPPPPREVGDDDGDPIPF